MTNRAETAAAVPDLDEQSVADYLRAHPDFLTRHGDVLAAMEVPHRPGGDAVSLIERQVAELRQRNERLEQRLTELMRTARANERVGARLLALGRGLLEADSLDGVLALVRDTLLSEFAADEAVVVLIAAGDEPGEVPAAHRLSTDAAALFEACLARGEPVCGPLEQAQKGALFGDRAERVESAALVPLRAGGVSGLIGLGSHEAGHFGADMGTLFLEQLGELVSAGVTRYIPARA